MSLFHPTAPEPDINRPLAERLRPRTLEEYVGQQHILGEGKPLRRQIERDQLSSLILWGPPGAGRSDGRGSSYLRRVGPKELVN